MNETTKSSGEQAEAGATSPQIQAKAGLFQEHQYRPFLAGVFVIGGLIALPLTYGLAVELEYLAALPWSLGSCVVFLIAFRRNGTISWFRAIPAIFALVVAGNVYNQTTGKPAFGAGGMLGFLLLLGCGYVGIGVGKLFGVGRR